MALIVADASVVVAWLFPAREPDTTAVCAGALGEGVRTGALLLRQPPHWLAEAAAVVARLRTATALEDVGGLVALEVPVLDTPEVYLSACSLATELDYHLFDTLYHAVALELDGATLVTADECYYRRARGTAGSPASPSTSDRSRTGTSPLGRQVRVLDGPPAPWTPTRSCRGVSRQEIADPATGPGSAATLPSPPERR